MSEPESIERDGVSYVPRLWLQSNRDAFDTCLAQLTAAEARIAALEAAARDVLTDRDLTAIIANTTAYEYWVRHRAALAVLLEEG